MKAPEGFAHAVGYVCLAVVAVFVIQCAQSNNAKGRCVTWTNGTLSCSGAACEHCKPLGAPALGTSK